MEHLQTTKGGDLTDNKTRRPATPGSLWKRVSELGASSAFLMYLADAASEKMTLRQAAFFMLAAAADASGRPATRTQLLASQELPPKSAVRNSYRQLLEPSRPYPDALGWLSVEENPLDAREQFLRLTDKGKAVVEGALLALAPIVSIRNALAHSH